MPAVAKLYALPESIRKEGVQRYGFHGLSYEYILLELKRQLGAQAVKKRIILAHLGHGASMAAVKNGKSIETTMGFSPAGGLVMSTRSGDLDPGVILFLLQQNKMTPAAIKEMLNRQSGLIGVSGSTDDMRDLLKVKEVDDSAKQAIELFCYQARKYIGTLSVVLGGLDSLVFTGGIGEHSSEIRSRICAGLEFLGIRVDEEKNSRHAAIISPESGQVEIRIIKTNEELMIARHTMRILEKLNR
jgi:acetate kinase